MKRFALMIYINNKDYFCCCCSLSFLIVHLALQSFVKSSSERLVGYLEDTSNIPRACQYFKVLVLFVVVVVVLSSAGSCGPAASLSSSSSSWRLRGTTRRNGSDDRGSFSYFSLCDSLSYHYMVRVYIISKILKRLIGVTLLYNTVDLCDDSIHHVYYLNNRYSKQPQQNQRMLLSEQ